MNRGDVVLVRFPHPSGLRGKKRPAVIVQSDAYAGRGSTLGTPFAMSRSATARITTANYLRGLPNGDNKRHNWVIR
jgi:mRNA-degrading endonuclease toxin of MazEF toxin-antitoxin module